MALKGIVIDPGHGGTDPGAVGNNIKEKDYTLLISKYMYDRFKELGIPVRMTRDTDVTLSPSERTSKVQSFFGDGKDVIVISNHINAGGGKEKSVIKKTPYLRSFFYYYFIFFNSLVIWIHINCYIYIF
jgi:N-acetylmuramoyl-L-alanine amidase